MPSCLKTSLAPISVKHFVVLSLALPPRSHNMPWQGKSECLEHHRPALERIVNNLPPAWLLAPESGEIFNSLECREHCDRRLRSFSQQCDGKDGFVLQISHNSITPSSEGIMKWLLNACGFKAVNICAIVKSSGLKSAPTSRPHFPLTIYKAAYRLSSRIPSKRHCVRLDV